MMPQQLTRFDRFMRLLEIGVGIYESLHGFPNLWAVTIERIDRWKYEGGNTFTLGSCPDPLDKMVTDYLKHVYEAKEAPYWLKVLEGN